MVVLFFWFAAESNEAKTSKYLILKFIKKKVQSMFELGGPYDLVLLTLFLWLECLFPPGWLQAHCNVPPEPLISQYLFIHLAGEKLCKSEVSCPRQQLKLKNPRIQEYSDIYGKGIGHYYNNG